MFYLLGDFWIVNNETLGSIISLESINPNTLSDLVIQENPMLSECDAEGVCSFLTLPNADITISDNAPGCNSIEQVQTACFPSVEESTIGDSFSVSPNPTSASVNLRYMISDLGYMIFDLIDITGTKVKSLTIQSNEAGTHEMEIDLCDVPAGIYFCVLKTNQGIQTKKIVKL